MSTFLRVTLGILSLLIAISTAVAAYIAKQPDEPEPTGLLVVLGDKRRVRDHEPTIEQEISRRNARRRARVHKLTLVATVAALVVGVMTLTG
jgi:hypothetical protein